MGQFIKQTLASIIGTLVGLFLFITLGFAGLVFLIAATASKTSEQAVRVKDKSVLVFNLSTEIRDKQPTFTLNQALSSEPSDRIALRQLVKTIEKASTDKRIVALFLDGRGGGGANGYATLREVRAALEEFRATGKKIIAHDDSWSEKEYYLGSVADLVTVNPMGGMEINGLASEPLFFTGAQEKYGIGVQTVRVGKYKSAVEPFTRKDLSPENREQIQGFLNDLWGEFLGQVGKSRELSPEKLQEIADTKGLIEPEAAKEQKIVDRVAYFDEIAAEFRKISGVKDKNKSFRSIDLNTYANRSRVLAQQQTTYKNTIAVVYAEGAIVDGKGTAQEIGGDRFAKELRKLRQDKNVKAVVLRVNSPGGSATASEVIARELELIREQKKPVIISMGNVAASGGYWISTGADSIFAQPNTITGSIGVLGLFPNIKAIANDNGFTWDIVKTGRFADSFTTTRPKTEEELKILQEYINRIYDLFLERVAKARNLSKEEVAEIAGGRVWSGEDAKEIGLVDQMGGLQAAIEYAAEKAELGKDWKVREYPRVETLEEIIFKNFSNARSLAKAQHLDPLTAEYLKLKEDLAILQSLNDPRGVYAIMPFRLRIE
ncbi:MAG: signal peptide peptidase SppA [Prochloraceae cyanobacterium]|nr:signal peptide peptidase SppA [Prochloraceae cyanobacterium]